MKFLILTSVYPPDPASVGQHLADVAIALAERGHSVRVITSDRGYDDPTIRFPNYEMSRGVEIIRLKWSSFGKKSIIDRIAGQLLFSFQTIIKMLLSFCPDVIIITTSPPLSVISGYILKKIKRSKLVYWVMDINPDEAIAMGLLNPFSPVAVLLDLLNRIVLSHADRVIVLDSYMATRIRKKAILRREPIIIPPWPHEDAIKKSTSNGRKFRSELGLQDKFIVMYSGNHSWVHPLDTILGAARKLSYRKDIVFIFIGGGIEKRKVEQAIKNRASNIISLPYQDLDNLGESLAAADVHLVVMGEAMVGIVHPCKIYGAMAVGRPILAVAPDNSHITDIIRKHKIGFRYSHGDINGVIRGILSLAEMDKKEREFMGKNAAKAIKEEYSQDVLRNKFIEILEGVVNQN